MKDAPVRQHTVPKTYLKLFVAPETVDEVWVFRKIPNDVRRMSVASVTIQNNFYDFEFTSQEFNDAKHIERERNRSFESTINKLLWRIAYQAENRKSFLLKPAQKAELAVQLAYQYMRTKGFRVAYENLISAESPERVLASAEPEDDRFGKMLLSDASLIQIAKKLFHEYEWVFRVNRTNAPYVTSDNPVIFTNDVLPGFPYLLGHPDVFGFFPLTPRVLLFMVPKGQRYASMPDGQAQPSPGGDFVKMANTFQVLAAVHEVFSAERSFLDYMAATRVEGHGVNMATKVKPLYQKIRSEAATMEETGTLLITPNTGDS